MTAAGAAPLPDISLSESAAQIVDAAMATNATVLTTLRTIGRWVLTISRNFSIKKVCGEHMHGALPVKAFESLTVLATAPDDSHAPLGRALGGGLGGKSERDGTPRVLAFQ